jgi:hypothetical protein
VKAPENIEVTQNFKERQIHAKDISEWDQVLTFSRGFACVVAQGSSCCESVHPGVCNTLHCIHIKENNVVKGFAGLSC